MLFNKYQYRTEDLAKRGYSQSTPVLSEDNKIYWAKWILGISKTDTNSKILADKLRHLQKARHNVLPDIIEYGYDEEQNAFAIVYELLKEVNSLEGKVMELTTNGGITGLLDVVDCLKELHAKYGITHGDLHPGNILIDGNGRFYLVDFGLAVITRTLSQEKELEVFAREFAAPEKLGRLKGNGFPYQSDIYSIGKILDWFFHERQQNLEEDFNLHFQKLLAENPSERPNWQGVEEIFNQFGKSAEVETAEVAFQFNDYRTQILNLLSDKVPHFNVSPNEGSNYLMDVFLGEYICEGVIWIKDEDKLLFKSLRKTIGLDPKIFSRKKKNATKLPFPLLFSENPKGQKADLTPHFQRWFEIQHKKSAYQKIRNSFQEELNFYKELLKEELNVIHSKALKLQYDTYRTENGDLILGIVENEKCSSKAHLYNHIQIGNSPNSEGFEYNISANADRKQNKQLIQFVGKPYEFDSEKRQLKIKDCERLKTDLFPQKGFLFESISKKEEEKKRQLDAIRKTENNEVQNPELIFALFRPSEIDNRLSELPELEMVFQKDSNSSPLIYSYNQQKAILQALHKRPLSVIQGPPGTGKTTVITEIVFQILHTKPESKILITSQTNNAVDQVLENLVANQIPVLRLNGIRPPKSKVIQSHTLDNKLVGWKKQVKDNAEKNFKARKEIFERDVDAKSPVASNFIKIILESENWEKSRKSIEKLVSNFPSLKALQQLPEDPKEGLKVFDRVFDIDFSTFHKLYQLHRDWLNTVSALDENSPLNLKLVDSIRVIGATCNHIASKKYSKYNFEFDYVIMDESGKATTSEALVPIITGKNLVFVGDHRQLRPVLTQTREVESWLRNRFKEEAQDLEDWDEYFNRPSLFESVIENIEQDFKSQLTDCRRLPEEAVQLTSKCFYEEFEDEKIVFVPRDTTKEHNLKLQIQSSLFFIDIGSAYRNKIDENKSSYNEVSAKTIANILELLNKYEPVKDYSFGVITGYTAQSKKLKREIDLLKSKNVIANITKWKKPEEKLTVSVVDQFQGLEKDIIIMDLVKSGGRLDLGFLEVPNRINVALSRHKRLLIIVGDFYSIINAPTRKNQGKKAALQHYLELIPKPCIIKADQIEALFK